MRKLNLSSIIVILINLLIGNIAWGNPEPIDKSRTTSFDVGWRFIKANPPGAENPSYDDSGWRTLDLPHDWSIEDLSGQDGDSIIGPFSKASIGKMGTGYTVGGTAWYRKTFTMDKVYEDKIVYLQFDGIYMNSDVWVNGKHVGNHPHGYTSFWYDISPYLNQAGQPNVVAVQVKNEGINARWYSGSGIYRHTWLVLANPVHVAPWGVFITTPEVSEEKANIEVVTNVSNSETRDLAVSYVVRLIDPSGKEVGKSTMKSSVPAGNSVELKQVVQVDNPALWSLEKPNLYHAEVSLLVNNKVEDKVNTAFGIRTINFDAQTGFTLNGKTIKLRGGCFHHDNGPLGAAAIDRAEERKIEILKKAGFNAIRCSHNPPSPYLLDVCDRLGMLVIDEAFDMWEKSKLEGAYKFFGLQGTNYTITDHSQFFKEWWQKDIQSIVLRDRNHPSIIMWSIGNEIAEAADTSGLRIAANLVNEIKKYDRTRAVTEAHVDAGAAFGGKITWDERAPHMALLDVVGYNYGFAKYRGNHEKFPERIMYASEFNPPLSLQNWQAVEELSYVIGNFSWTAMDYMGESGTGVPRLVDIKPNETVIDPRQEIPTPALIPAIMVFFNPESWPMFVNYQGDIDLIGNPKVPYYYQHVVWRDIKVSMFVHTPIPVGKREVVSRWGFPNELKSWNWEGHEGEKMQVNVYTRSKLVKLELNGKPGGEQAVDDSKSITATFEVPYEPGTLTARCFD
ncbi:MAG: glycoside hydrolase family 2 TIM barrel-domain containing protein, partial [Bacteroidales bacterium]|nr:glycoside hydrolase family 2 TIM barrel-domain containing protein [Bacteroidales bacterium]